MRREDEREGEGEKRGNYELSIKVAAVGGKVGLLGG